MNLEKLRVLLVLSHYMAIILDIIESASETIASYTKFEISNYLFLLLKLETIKRFIRSSNAY